MILNIIKIALRNFRRHKGTAVLNLAGLAVGMACALAMVLHLARELSYDRHNKHASRIVRLTSQIRRDDQVRTSAYASALPPLAADFPEIEAEVRLFSYSWREKALVARGERAFYEEGFFLADPSIFEVFTLPFIAGDPSTALAEPRSIVLSESAARRYFGKESALGGILSVKNMQRADLVVRGVFRDVPAASHFHPDLIAPLAAGEFLFWENFEIRNSFHRYMRLRQGASPAELEAKLPGFFLRHAGSAAGPQTLRLQRLTDVHLRSRLDGEIEPNGDIRSLRLFVLLTVLVLASACINYVNLATARSETRALETGLRKAMGADRPRLILQFLGESFVGALLSLPAALLLLQLLLPPLNAILHTELSMAAADPWLLAAGLGCTVVVIGFATGLYPAVVLSRFEPASVLKGRLGTGGRRLIARGALVVVQSAAAIILMVGTIVVYRQMRFIQNKDLGFDRGQVVVLPLKDWESVQAYPRLKTSLAGSPEITYVTASESLPSNVTRRHDAWHEGAPLGIEAPILWSAVDYDFLETFGMTLVVGRSFSPTFSADAKRAYIINETAARTFGWNEPLGRRFSLSNKNLQRPIFEEGQIVGVVKDFHSRSLRGSIEPLVLSLQPDAVRYASLRFREGRTKQALEALASRWKEILPGRPLEFSFLDETVNRMYQEERRTGRIFGYAAALSLCLSGLGLIGMASFAAARRTKEIGIRKTMGASVLDIVRLLSGNFLRLFLIANVLAWPTAYVLMRSWLMDFAYRIGLGPSIFLLASALAFLLLAVSVGFKALRAALADPVQSLRYE